MLAARAPRSLVAMLVLCAVTLLCAGAGRARAGSWTLVACSQPNGQPAPTDGWSAAWWAGAATPGSGDSNTCAAPGGALVATSSQAGAAAAYTGPEWVFNAPGGATIAGGSITAALSAPQGEAWVGTPGPAPDGADVIAGCPQGAAAPCQGGASDSGTFALDHPGGTSIYAAALCVQAGSSTCPAAGAGVNAQVAITRAEIELSVAATPTASNFSGSLLSRGASGTADLVFTASDPGATGGFGPGVYAVSVQIDGRTVYQGVPDAHRGRCAALGTDPATGGLIFDHEQPCAPLAKLTIPVATNPFSDGRHQLTVAMSDAAGDTAAVLSRSITTSNPVISPPPRRRREVDARLTTGWSFGATGTELVSAHASGLPARGSIAVVCTGRGCPRLSLHRVTVARIGRLWTQLRHGTFHSGDRLELTIRAPHRRAEPIEFLIRAGRRPTVRLLHAP